MRAFSVIVLAGLCALACGYVTPGQQFKNADKEFLAKQKSIFELLQHVHQNDVQPELYDVAKLYKIEDHYDNYNNVEAVKEFFTLYQHGLLPMNEIFTVYNEYHKNQVISLFHFFYYAKDWATFYQSILWARYHVNEGMFVYALTVAALHRSDMAGIVLPAPYEIYPYYFFNSETIQSAQNYKMQGFHGLKKVEGVYNPIILSNYSTSYVHVNSEQKISYFTEDIGLNSYFYYFHADYPFWMGGSEFNLSKDRRGELYLFEHQQLLARYYLERLSNDLGIIPEFSWYEPIATGYYPALRYYNGAFFPARDNFYNVYTEQNYYDIDLVEDYEHRIREALFYGFIVLPDGSHVDLTLPESVEFLGSFIQGNADNNSTRFYGYFETLAKTLLGGSFGEHFHHHQVIPSVLEHFETSMRDPVFYQLYKRIIKFYWQFKDTLPYYKYNEIAFQGVKIESVEVDKLVTYFDNFDADITNAVDVESFDIKAHSESEYQKFGRVAHYQGEDFVIKARQRRLNHLPFSFKLNVNADKPSTSVVRVYIGPKYDEFGHVYHINENRENFVFLDSFKYELVAGKNVISRNSNEFSWYVKDRTTYFELYKHLMTAYNGGEKFQLDQTESHSGMPNRLLLPKGKKGGMPFQLYFIVSPYLAPALEQFSGYDHFISSGVGSGARYVDSLPLGFPFDRKIDETVWYTPNMYYYDVNIFHKKEADVNTVQ